MGVKGILNSIWYFCYSKIKEKYDRFYYCLVVYVVVIFLLDFC